MMNLTQTFSLFCADHPHIFIVGLILLGLCIGSFINVIASRLPIMMKRQWYKDSEALKKEVPFSDHYPKQFNLCLPRSHCSHCQTPIAAFHNIPLLSFLWLKGKCGSCQKAISWKYPFVECLAGALLISIYFKFGCSVELLAYSILGFGLLSLSIIDMDEMFIPDEIVYPLLWSGLIFHLSHISITLEDAVVGACVGYLSLWSVFWCFKILTGKEGLGYGDFKLMAALGAWLGWQSIPLILFLGSIIGLLFSALAMLIQKKSIKQPIPFGPSLAIAGWIALLYGDVISEMYLMTWS